jgi:hypothetical protein
MSAPPNHRPGLAARLATLMGPLAALAPRSTPETP